MNQKSNKIRSIPANLKIIWKRKIRIGVLGRSYKRWWFLGLRKAIFIRSKICILEGIQPIFVSRMKRRFVQIFREIRVLLIGMNDKFEVSFEILNVGQNPSRAEILNLLTSKCEKSLSQRNCLKNSVWSLALQEFAYQSMSKLQGCSWLEDIWRSFGRIQEHEKVDFKKIELTILILVEEEGNQVLIICE